MSQLAMGQKAGVELVKSAPSDRINARGRFEETGDVQVILDWIETGESDVGPCDCCGNGDAYGWYFVPGLHDLSDKSAPFPNCY